jgi:hypothetical protein
MTSGQETPFRLVSAAVRAYPIAIPMPRASALALGAGCEVARA